MSNTGTTGPLHVLFPPAVRLRLGAALTGSIVVSLIETGSVLLLLPLMDALGGTSNAAQITNALSRLLGNPSRSTLIAALVGLVLGGFVIKDLFTLAFRWWMLGFLQRQLVSTSSHMLDYFLHAPYALHLRRTMADMMRSMTDSVSQFYGRTVNGSMGIISESLTIVTIMGALLVMLPLPTLAMLAYFGVAALIYQQTVKPRVEAAGRRQLEAGREMFEATIHSFGGIKEIKIRHSQPHFVDRYRRAALANAHEARVSSFLVEAPKYLLEVLFIAGLAGLILATAGSSPGGVVSTLALLAAAAFRVLPALTRLLAAITTVRSGEPARKLLWSELEEEARLAPLGERSEATTTLPFRSQISVQGVGFTYEDATEPVLSDVSFTVEAGSSVALVGGSGAGKTTLANLLLGLHAPTQGRITVDGVDIAQRMAEWQRNIAFVPQDVFHMDLPFSQNIAFDQYPDEIDQAQLAAAIDRAQLTDLIAELPKGLSTTIGDRGIRLSGGQRQRIGIARALYRDPTLLVLDEATSALDNETERKVTETIEALHGRITVVVIAHRLSTVRNVDKVVLMSNGRVSAVGTFPDLAAHNDEFAHFVALGALTEEP